MSVFVGSRVAWVLRIYVSCSPALLEVVPVRVGKDVTPFCAQLCPVSVEPWGGCIVGLCVLGSKETEHPLQTGHQCWTSSLPAPSEAASRLHKQLALVFPMFFQLCGLG